MPNQKKFKSFKSYRTSFLCLLFLAYYGLIALICWPLLSENPESAKKLSAELKGLLPVIVCLGLGAGVLLFASALREIEGLFKTYWRERNWKGFEQASRYYALNVTLVVFPSFLIGKGYVLSQQIDLLPFFLSITLFLAYAAYCRFKGFETPGVSTCVH